MENIVPAEIIENRIFLIRGQKVMLDMHLAELYGVSTFRLNEAAKRNAKRFPADFMFQLTKEEEGNLISQFAMSSWGGRRYLPYAFTEQGVAMLSSILRSDRAIKVNILIMRTFVKIRELMATHLDLARKIEDLERKYGEHDEHIQAIFKLIKDLLQPSPEPPKEEGAPMGFQLN